MTDNVLSLFYAFLEKIAGFNKIFLFHDRDADGISAGVITAAAIKKITGRKPFFIEAVDYPKLSKQLKKAINSDLVIIVDVAIDARPDMVKEIEKNSFVLVIDHHKIVNDLNSKKTVFIKPQMFSGIEPASYPASKFCLDLFSKKIDLSEKEWVACIGIFGDVSYNQWKSFVDRTAKKYGLKPTDFEWAAKIVASVETMNPVFFTELFDILYSSKSPDKALKKLEKYESLLLKLEKELDFHLKDFEENAEEYPENQLFIYTFKPKNNIKSILATLLSFKHEDKTIVIIQDMGNEKLSFSARRQDMCLPVNDLLVRAIKGLKNASAGGHKPAAAGTIQKKDFKKFKKQLILSLKKMSEKR